MTRRVTNTYKILAIAAVATATATGCGPSGGQVRSPEQDPDATVADLAQPSANDGATTPAAAQDPTAIGVALEFPANDATPEARPPLPPGPMASLHPDHQAELNTLLGELLRTDKDIAMTTLSHFRPLCDDLGYPLVGNVQRKGIGTNFQPSQLCAEVRAKGTR